tara:strand:- start:9506 stop:9901 length:396 start_codon:yes stop_codon:yes gene_type:complete
MKGMIVPIEQDGPRNVLGEKLQPCCERLNTGWFRNGSCETAPGDSGRHVICCVMTDEFLAFSQAMGNDLSTPVPEYDFPGLREGDCWCLCAERWREALEAGVAPKVKLAACEQSALEIVDLEDLKAHDSDS